MSQVAVTSIVCNQCGAPLPLQGSTRFLTCAHCGAQLEVHRSPDAIYTEVLEALDERTQKLTEEVESLKRDREIDWLDRDWAVQRESFLSPGTDGRMSEPSTTRGVFAIIGGTIFGGLLIFNTLASGTKPAGAFLGVLVFVIAVIGGVLSIAKARRFDEAKRIYQHRRRQLLNAERLEQMVEDTGRVTE